MYKINDDLSIYVTRGDMILTSVSALADGKQFTFCEGDIVRIRVFRRKNCAEVVLSKEFLVTEDTQNVQLFLSGEDTKIGEVISKPKEYWYEVELNPHSDPQTIIGYDEDGAKRFVLFPEGADKKTDAPAVSDGIETEVQGTLLGTVVNPDVIYGKSAYDIAVEKGFVGTKEEWLNFLSAEATEKAQVFADAAEDSSQEAETAAQNAASFATQAAEAASAAEASMETVQGYAQVAEKDAKNAEVMAQSATEAAQQASYHAANVALLADNANQFAANAKNSEDSAKEAEIDALSYAAQAKNSVTQTEQHATSASVSAQNAASRAAEAASSAVTAAGYASEAKQEKKEAEIWAQTAEQEAQEAKGFSEDSSARSLEAQEHAVSAFESADRAAEEAARAQSIVEASNEHLRGELEPRVERNSKRIANLEQGLTPDPFLTDSSTAYVKDVPTNALPYAEVTKVGGMSYKISEMIQDVKVREIESIGVNLLNERQRTDGSKGSWKVIETENGFEYFGDGSIIGGWKYLSFPKIHVKQGITYYFGGVVNTENSYARIQLINADTLKQMNSLQINAGRVVGTLIPTTDADIVLRLMFNSSNATGVLSISNLFVMTADLPYSKYFQYDFSIPPEIQSLNGYGLGISDTYHNYIDWRPEEGIKRFVQTCVERDYIEGDELLENTVTDGATRTVYVLDEPVITDLTDLLPDDNLIKVEAGGTVTMVNEHGLAVPSEITYMLKEETE